jgi:hypothetical protein
MWHYKQHNKHKTLEQLPCEQLTTSWVFSIMVTFYSERLIMVKDFIWLSKQTFELVHKIFRMRPLVVGLMHDKRKQGREWLDMHNIK